MKRREPKRRKIPAGSSVLVKGPKVPPWGDRQPETTTERRARLRAIASNHEPGPAADVVERPDALVGSVWRRVAETAPTRALAVLWFIDLVQYSVGAPTSAEVMRATERRAASFFESRIRAWSGLHEWLAELTAATLAWLSGGGRPTDYEEQVRALGIEPQPLPEPPAEPRVAPALRSMLEGLDVNVRPCANADHGAVYGCCPLLVHGVGDRTDPQLAVCADCPEREVVIAMVNESGRSWR